MSAPENNKVPKKTAQATGNIRTKKNVWTNGQDVAINGASNTDIEAGKYQAILNSINDAFAFCELIRDADGAAVNYRYVDFNASFEKLQNVQRAHFLGRTALDVHPGLDPWWIITYQQAVDTCAPVYAERFFDGRWFDINIFPFGNDYFSVIFKDITARRTAREDLRESGRLLTRDLNEARLLQHISNCIIEEDNINASYGGILNSSMALMSADFASIQVLIPEKNELLLLACKHFHPDSAKYWQSVKADSTTSSGKALANGVRVIIHDINHSYFEIATGDYDNYRLSGIVSMQSTPLISRAGNNLGIISTYWKKPHTPSERELTLFDVVARQVADLVERRKAEEALRESRQKIIQELEDAKLLQQISNQIIEEDKVETLYQTILLSAMELMRADFASIQLFIPETNQLLLIASRNFHPDSAKFWEYIDADSTSACGLALANGARVIFEDIEHLQFNLDKGDYDAFRLSGIVSAQSTPLVSRSGNRVGMISTQWRQPHKPSERELALYDIIARQVADLLERKQAEAALRESEYKLREFNNTLEQQVKERTDELNQSLLNQKEQEARQQQEIFRTVLDTQEAERKRIAESLHNGIGQVLYGAKLSLGQALKADIPENDKQSLRDVDKLLNDAITESRRLSHELIPVVLEDFGLKVAVEDICRQLSGNTQFTCRFKGFTKRFDKYAEVSIYRIIQELMTNIVKHSQASEGLVALEMRKGQMLILIQDNGKGIDTAAGKSSGIGLKTILNKVSLLKGNINIESRPGKGTAINIDLPF